MRVYRGRMPFNVPELVSYVLEDSESRGALESVEEVTQNTALALGRLIDLLMDKGLVDVEQLSHIIGTGSLQTSEDEAV